MRLFWITKGKWGAAATVAFSLVCSSIYGAGLAAFKQQPFHSNDLADIIVYSKIQEGAASYLLDLGTREVPIDRQKIVEYVTVPELPANLVDENTKAQLRQVLAELVAFASRYKKATAILKPHIDQLKMAIARREAGDVLLDSKWMSKDDYAAKLRKLQMEQQAREEAVRKAREAQMKLLEDTVKRNAEKERLAKIEKEREIAYATEQRNKGLEMYGNIWLPRSEVEAFEKRDAELRTAERQINEKSVSNMKFVVLAVGAEGMLIQPKDGDKKPQGINLDVAFLYDTDNGTVAVGDLLTKDVFWSGTRSFDTEEGPTPIHTYMLGKGEAVAKVRSLLFGEDAKRAHSTRKAEVAGTSPQADPSKPLEGASGSGSGFFVGDQGHFVTNEHVVEGASVVQIYYEDQLLPAKVLHVSKVADLALLKVEKAVAGIVVGEEEIELGMDVYAIGFPNPDIQGIEVKVTKGIISSKRGLNGDDTRFQVDAAIQPGNSGGPLCDSSGRLVGVVVATLNSVNVAKMTGSIPQNVNYAIKASELSAFLRSRSVRLPVPPSSGGSASQAPASDGVKTAVAVSGLVIVKK